MLRRPELMTKRLLVDGRAKIGGSRGQAWTPDEKSGARILGGVGRLGARRNGFGDLRAGAGAFAARFAAALRDCGNERKYWILRRTAVRDFFGGLGDGVPVGTDRR